MPQVKITISIPRDTVDRLKKVSEKTDIPQSRICDKGIQAQCDKLEKAESLE
jgi:predicted transcriptional regulator